MRREPRQNKNVTALALAMQKAQETVRKDTPEARALQLLKDALQLPDPEPEDTHEAEKKGRGGGVPGPRTAYTWWLASQPKPGAQFVDPANNNSSSYQLSAQNYGVKVRTTQVNLLIGTQSSMSLQPAMLITVVDPDDPKRSPDDPAATSDGDGSADQGS